MKKIILIFISATLILIFFNILSYDINLIKIDINNNFEKPSLTHLFGTDELGRDIFKIIIRALYNSCFISFMVVSVSSFIGVSLALFSKQNKLTSITEKIIDGFFIIPVVLTAILLQEIFNFGKYNAIIALSLIFIPVFYKTISFKIQKIQRSNFVTASRIYGCSYLRSIFVHVLPNTVNLVIAQLLINFSIILVAESSLSYLGVSTEYPEPSLGGMILQFQPFMFSDPILIMYPTLCIISIASFFFYLGNILLKDKND